MRPLHILLIVVVIVVWAGNFAVVKSGLEELPPLFFAALRFVCVALLLLPFAAFPRGRFRALTALALTLGLVHFTLIFVGVTMTDASVASILAQTQVPFAALLSAIVFRDVLGWRRGVGMLLSMVGVAIIAGMPQEGSTLLGMSLVVAASLMWGLANIQMKLLADLDGLVINAWMAVLAAPMLLAASLLAETGHWAVVTTASWRAWGAVLFQAIAVVIFGYTVWYAMLRRYTVNQVMPFTLLLPPVSVMWAVILLGERVTWSLVVGGVVTVAGVAIILVRRPRTVARSTLDT